MKTSTARRTPPKSTTWAIPVDECRYFCDAIPSALFRWAFTVNHAHLAPEGINGFIDAFGVARIGAVRLADSAGAVAVHLPPGPGNIDFPATFRRLESAGYDGYYTMAFGSIADQLAARELVPHLRHLASHAAAPAYDASRCCCAGL